jgi:hypothetical protein
VTALGRLHNASHSHLQSTFHPISLLEVYAGTAINRYEFLWNIINLYTSAITRACALSSIHLLNHVISIKVHTSPESVLGFGNLDPPEGA